MCLYSLWSIPVSALEVSIRRYAKTAHSPVDQCQSQLRVYIPMLITPQNAFKQPSSTINRCHDNLCFKQLLTWPLNEDGLYTDSPSVCVRGFLQMTQMKQHPLLCSKAHSRILSCAKQEGLQVHPVIKYTLRHLFIKIPFPAAVLSFRQRHVLHWGAK